MACPSPDPVLCLDDLPSLSLAPHPLAVLGHPISHSLSPAMHNAALRRLAEREARFADWRYYRFDVPPTDLALALRRLREYGFVGLNLTIPHKVEALPLVESVDPDAAEMGAVNTLRATTCGWEGFNTDGFGISQAVQQALGWALGQHPVILLGAGGAARAVACQCLREGCPDLWIGNRSAPRLAELADILRPIPAPSTRLRFFSLESIPADLPRSGLLLNLTSLGLKAEDPAPIALDRWGPDLKVFDTTYGNPRNALLQQARDRGMEATDGLLMLVWQGVRSLSLWTGAEVQAAWMEAAARHALGAAR